MTGGSGYVAGWIIARLLEEGRAVRATLRDMARADAVRADIANVARDTASLEFVAADLLADAGWEAAMQGVRHVVHVASPVMARRGVDTLAVAVDGTRRVLRAAAAAGVERIVLTSSAAAARASADLSRPADESDWTDARASGIDTYTLSKTLAERAAWDFAREHPAGPKIATVLPGFVQGLLLGRNASASLGVVGQMLGGKMPAVPRLGFVMIDVRDLADLHVRVLDDPKGMGERWIASTDFLWLADVAAVLRERLGHAASRVPKRTMSDWLVSLLSLANRDMRPLVAELGKRREFSSAKAGRILDWHPRAASEAVIATAESLLAKASPAT
ncbi:NAD-dependent epimerase/dehydratase family protein [Niveibacterium sp. SC-1]|uniref:NAD-dependent epimerase/dehydratase family protein n=1 Tax=Niveibacterium sp. SC-1 TaxID=3135646 RepID=UPI00311FD13A